MRAPRIASLPLAALCCSIASLLALATPARAQEEGDPLPESEHPGSDSPESVNSAVVRNASGRKRAQAFLIPLDEKARIPTGRVAMALERALAASRQYEVVDLAKALASDAEPAEEHKAAEGRRILGEANSSFSNRTYSDAVQRYKAAIKQLTSGLAAIEPRELADAYLRLGAAQQLSGEPHEVKASRDSYLTAALLDPQQKLSVAAVDPVVEQPLMIARNDLDQIPIGKLEVDTRPAGARVIVDGQPQGQTPAHLELTGGKHVLKLERTGFYPSAELLDVASRRETQYSITLSATPGASSLNQLIAGSADEAQRGRAGERSQELAGRFRLDRILIGSVSSHGPKVSLLLALMDPFSGAMIGRQDLLLTADGTDSDQLEFEAQEAALKLFALDDGAAPNITLPPQGQANGSAAPATPAPGGSYPPLNPPPAPEASGSRRMMMPGSEQSAPPPAEPNVDDPGLVAPEHHPLPPIAEPPASGSASASADKAPPSSSASDAKSSDGKDDKGKKKKRKDLHGKSGTEGWDAN